MELGLRRRIEEPSSPKMVTEEREDYESPSSTPEEDSSDDYSSDEEFINNPKSRRIAERRLEHYTSSHRLLLVGEGDFSFALCLARAFSSAHNIVATSLDTHRDLAKKYSNAIENVRVLEEMGGLVLDGVDATKMSQHHFLSTQRFDCIVYNFPHVGFLFPEDNGCQIKLNKQLVKGFLSNAKVLIKKEDGEIHVTNKDGYPYDKWNLVKKAEKLGLVLHESVPFRKDKYPGYSNKRAHGGLSDAPFRLGGCTTFKFRVVNSR